MYYLWIASVLVLLAAPVVLMWNRFYEDGLFGRVALIGVSFSAFIFALKVFTLDIKSPWPETVTMMVSFAIFMIWHLVKFFSELHATRKAQEGKAERRHHKPYHQRVESGES